MSVESTLLRETAPRTVDDYSTERREMPVARLKDALETRMVLHALVFVLKWVLFILLIVFCVQTLAYIVAKRVTSEWLRLRESALNERFAENPNLYDFRFYVVDEEPHVAKPTAIVNAAKV